MQIIILTIDDDGRTRAYHTHTPTLRLSDLPYLDLLTPVRSGDDRGHYDVFEVAGVSIDVMRMPERNYCAPDCEERANCHSRGAPGHHFCGRRSCGCPRHHKCAHPVASIDAMEQQ